MKNLLFRILAAFLVVILLSSMANAFAVDQNGSDFQGHWAQAALKRALSDSLIDTNSAFNPDDAMTAAQVVSILSQVLSTGVSADLSNISDIKKDDWYYGAASHAVALGLITPLNGRLDLNEPVTRGKAFAAIANAFQLIGATPDTSSLSSYSDGDTLSGRYRLAAAALISSGFIGGYGGSLHINDNMSFAEFLTILYRIIPNKGIAGISGTSGGGALISGIPSLTGVKFGGAVYFDCLSSNISLQYVDAPLVVLRSDTLRSLFVSSSRIERFVVAAGSGDLTFSPDSSSSIGTAVIGHGGGTISLSGCIHNVEVTGDNRNVTVEAPIDYLLVSGSGNNIVIGQGCTVNTIKVLGSGTGNTLTISGNCTSCEIFGSNTTLNGKGAVQNLTDNAADSKITVSTAHTATNKGFGLNNVKLTLRAPDDLPSYRSLEASVSISAPPSNIQCRGAWYLNDVFLSKSDVTIGKTASETLNRVLQDRGDVPKTVTLSYVLSYSGPDGAYQELRADKQITLDNKTKFDTEEVLALVTTGYKGNYTLKWAQANDYDGEVKTAWVNAKGYSSGTDYLVWVSIAYQRVNVFSGSAGNWKLEKTFIVGTGAPGNDTPTGVFKIIGKNASGWTTKKYTVKPVVNFYSSAYGFHSRLYKPGTTTINDARIGFPVSHGCVRMYDEDIAWFYKNIPVGTTVVIY